MLLRANTTFKRTKGQEISEELFLVFKYVLPKNQCVIFENFYPSILKVDDMLNGP